MKKRNEMLTLMDDEEATVQGGNPMTVRREAAPPFIAKAGFACVFDFFSSQISSGGSHIGKANVTQRKARGGASAPFGGSNV